MVDFQEGPKGRDMTSGEIIRLIRDYDAYLVGCGVKLVGLFLPSTGKSGRYANFIRRAGPGNRELKLLNKVCCWNAHDFMIFQSL